MNTSQTPSSLYTSYDISPEGACSGSITVKLGDDGSRELTLSVGKSSWDGAQFIRSPYVNTNDGGPQVLYVNWTGNGGGTTVGGNAISDLRASISRRVRPTLGACRGDSLWQLPSSVERNTKERIVAGNNTLRTLQELSEYILLPYGIIKPTKNHRKTKTKLQIIKTG